MDFADCECELLYKQDLETWFEENYGRKKFSGEDLAFVQTVQQKFKFKYDENEDYDYRDKFCLDGRFGHLYYTEPDPVLFSFTDVNDTVTLYKRSLDEQPQDGGAEGPESGSKEAENSDSVTNNIDYQRLFLENVIIGSSFGGKILAYSSKGHMFLIDLDTRIGKLVAIWPIDPGSSGGGCYGLVPFELDIKAAVNGDFSLIAATGSREKEDEIQIRIFNLKTKECSLKSLKLHAGLLDSHVYMLSFNPCHPNLLYVSFIVSKSKYNSSKQVTDGEGSDEDDTDGVDADDGDDDDDADGEDDLLLLLFDLSTEKVLAEKLGISLFPRNMFYEMAEGATFLKQGSIVMTHKLIPYSSNMIVFLDAFTLEALGNANVTGKDAVLGNHALISSCKSQFAIFKCRNLDSSNELKYDVEVYKIPENEISLKNFCRKTILDKVEMNHIDSLSLPNVLKNYLKL